MGQGLQIGGTSSEHAVRCRNRSNYGSLMSGSGADVTFAVSWPRYLQANVKSKTPLPLHRFQWSFDCNIRKPACRGELRALQSGHRYLIWGATASGTSLTPKNTAGIDIFAANASFRRNPAKGGRKIDENRSLPYKPRQIVRG